MMENDYYKLLNISRAADKADIKRAYYAQIRVYTPEKDPERFKALREAYEYLSDDKKRAEYDKYADLPEKTANAAREAKQLIRNAQYAEAVELIKKNDKKDALKPLLVEAYLANGNSGMAVKLCESLIKRRKDDPQIAVLLSKSYRGRGYNNKALEAVANAVEKFPDNETVLSEYIRAHYQINEALPDLYFFRLRRVADKMAAYDYQAFQICLDCEMSDGDSARLPFLFSHFADGLMAANTITPGQYENAVDITYNLTFEEGCLETAKRLAPFLNSHKFRGDQRPKLDKIDKMLGISEMKGEIDGRLIEYLVFLTDAPKDIHGEERFYHEYDMVYEAESLRSSLIKLRDKYPKFFDMSKPFFFDLMNPTMYKKLRSRYEKKFKEGFPDDMADMDAIIEKMISDYKSGSAEEKEKHREELIKLNEMLKRFGGNGAGGGHAGDEDDDGEYDDIDGDGAAAAQNIREVRKVGRNEPCPCGSGKKYKQCCGRAANRAANE